jgi:hypothetical protein
LATSLGSRHSSTRATYRSIIVVVLCRGTFGSTCGGNDIQTPHLAHGTTTASTVVSTTVSRN